MDPVLFTMKPSQWAIPGWVCLGVAGIGWIILCLASGGPWWIGVIPIILWISNAIVLFCWSYEFRENTIGQIKGVFSQESVEIHYFRIKSVRLEEPFHLRVFGLSDVVVITSDPLLPFFRIHATGNGNNLTEWLKNAAQVERSNKGVKENDLHLLQ